MEPTGKTISAQDLLASISVRLGMVIMWLAFATFNLLIVLGAFFAAWICGVTPHEARIWFAKVFRLGLDPTNLAIARLLGASTIAILFALYAKLWRRLYASIVTPYLFKDIDGYLNE